MRLLYCHATCDRLKIIKMKTIIKSEPSETTPSTSRVGELENEILKMVPKITSESSETALLASNAVSELDNSSNHRYNSKCILCGVKDKESSTIKFHRFPRDPEMSEKWAQSCKSNSVLKASPIARYKRFRVCSLHFDEKDYKTKIKWRLNSNAIPVMTERFILPKTVDIDFIKKRLKLCLMSRPDISNEDLGEMAVDETSENCNPLFEMATKWGIVGAGLISNDFVSAVRSIPGNDHKIVAVAARNINSAKEFASRHGIPKAYGSYEDLAKDPDIEVAYIGTINTSHLALGKLMLENGKHVLVEKPMTLNLKQTKELIKTARTHKRFLMEAVWSRFLPSYTFLMEQLQKKVIGDVVHVSANFGKPLLHVERLVKKASGGSTILDLGVYTINAVSVVYNNENPLKIATVGHLNDDGVDISMASSLLYSNNRTAQVACSGLADLPNDLVITGTEGKIKIPSEMWCPTVVEINGKRSEFPLPDTVAPCNFENSSGLRYEAMEVRKCIKNGELESSIMPLKDSELLAKMMDEMRHQLGVYYDVD